MADVRPDAAEYHRSVLLDEVCEALAPAFARDGVDRDPSVPLRYVDLTTGGGGHARAVAERLRPDEMWLFDRDPEALAEAERALDQMEGPRPKIHRIHAPLSEAPARLDAAGVTEVHGVLADLGVSSHQLDEASRGFSFRGDGPLDMRMDPTQGETAAELIARSSADALAKILRDFGEEPDARRIAQALVEAKPTRTLEAARVVADAMSHRQLRNLGRRIDPATRTFQALRIAVNGELDQLDALLRDGPTLLAPGGRLAIISFHSLEDRRVKQVMRRLSRPPTLPVDLPIQNDDIEPAPFSVPRGWNRGATAGEEELAANPRSRSARLRVLERSLVPTPSS